MKRAIVLAVLLVATGTAAAAQDVPDRPIRRAEVIAAVKQQFARIDANHDGIVTRAEFAAFHASRAGGAADAASSPFDHIGAHWFDHADPDGTGRIALTQAEAHPLQLFDTADVNGDGTVSVEELRMAMALRSLTGR